MLRQTTQRGIDLKLFGAMFLLVGLIDMLIIEGFPAYALKLFGVTIAGPLAYLVKLHSPAAHFLIGYGFVFLRPWAWGLAMPGLLGGALKGSGAAAALRAAVCTGSMRCRAASSKVWLA